MPLKGYPLQTPSGTLSIEPATAMADLMCRSVGGGISVGQCGASGKTILTVRWDTPSNFVSACIACTGTDEPNVGPTGAATEETGPDGLNLNSPSNSLDTVNLTGSIVWERAGCEKATSELRGNRDFAAGLFKGGTTELAAVGAGAGAFVEADGASGGGERLTVSSPISGIDSLGRGRQDAVGEVGAFRQVDATDSFVLPGRSRGGVVGRLTTGDAGVVATMGRRDIRFLGITTKYFGFPLM